MNLAIELLVALIIIGFIILWVCLMFITKLWKLWRYKPENDKSRRAEESRRRFIGDGRVQRVVLPERRSLLQTTAPFKSENDSGSVGKIDNSVGETGRSIRNPFKRK
jgi:hypothetical protein